MNRDNYIFLNNQSLIDYTNLIIDEMESIKYDSKQREKFNKLFIELNRINNIFENMPVKRSLNKKVKKTNLIH